MGMLETARKFFDDCETGKGWEVCSQHCTPDATFSAQAEPLAGVDTLEGYTEWTKGILTPIPDGTADIQSFAVDEERGKVCVYSVFSGTHTGEGGPVPPTGKSAATDYVYVMTFQDGKIAHMTKIWNAGMALKALGWA